MQGFNIIASLITSLHWRDHSEQATICLVRWGDTAYEELPIDLARCVSEGYMFWENCHFVSDDNIDIVADADEIILCAASDRDGTEYVWYLEFRAGHESVRLYAEPNSGRRPDQVYPNVA